MSTTFQHIIEQELANTHATITAMQQDTTLHQALHQAGTMCTEAIQRGNKILFVGNGGSAADSQHLAAELVSRLSYDRPAMAGLALTTDTSALTAIGNDYGYDYVFARQIEAIGVTGDILVALSTSGQSANVLRAIETAKHKSIKVIGMTGNRPNTPMASLCDILLASPSAVTPKIQECHIALGHILCALVEEAIYGEQYRPRSA
jgi:D-sedoheptulose 7-phosphate isomerase